VIPKIFGSYNSRELKKLIPIANKIMNLDNEMTSLSDEELKNKTLEFKDRLSCGETLNDILVEAFAVVREASFRVLAMKQFKVQLIGGIVLHQGRIAEMKTGEGKTLVATCPAYLNALAGNGVHIITVNEYLAQRDKEEMGQIYNFLGLSTGVILNSMQPDERRQAYNCDITYGTNSEYGFDYLRDNMVTYPSARVQRSLNFAIIDEVDSIFIDDARTPLIISGQGKKSTNIYKLADRFTKPLKKEEDFIIDEKTKAIILTEQGIAKAEKYFGIENFADSSNMEIQHHTSISLKANFVMNNGVDYIIRDGEIVIIDQFTGRIMEGRRFNEGLHQAIEAKERVKIMEENDTLATITYQNYFKLYKKLSGMSGTAKTEEEEFREIYNLDVVVIPTNKPVARIDRPDVVYKTEYDKFKAVVDEIALTHKKQQPVLVGTASIDKSEILSFLLKKKGIPHQVLNAKLHAKEAEIVAKAGEKGMVTIATNMAGRGTDIKLGSGVKELGGLKIIGTERHEARRIDNQLRGRCARQGDVGEAVFFASLEDDIVKRFTKERLERIEETVKLEEHTPITSKQVRKIIDIAQHNVEQQSLETRKNLVKYDEVLSIQRALVYKQRNEIVDNEDITSSIEDMIKDVIDSEIDLRILDDEKFDEEYDEEVKSLLIYIADIIGTKKQLEEEKFRKLNVDEIKEALYEIALDLYHEKSKALGDEMLTIQKDILLRTVDTKWVEHIETMENLKKYIVYQSYRQTDPAVAYKLEGSTVFEDTMYNLKKDAIKYIFHIKVEK
jgi:preprotein translocase subunit SecA